MLSVFFSLRCAVQREQLRAALAESNSKNEELLAKLLAAQTSGVKAAPIRTDSFMVSLANKRNEFFKNTMAKVSPSLPDHRPSGPDGAVEDVVAVADDPVAALHAAVVAKVISPTASPPMDDGEDDSPTMSYSPDFADDDDTECGGIEVVTIPLDSTSAPGSRAQTASPTFTTVSAITADSAPPSAASVVRPAVRPSPVVATRTAGGKPGPARPPGAARDTGGGGIARAGDGAPPRRGSNTQSSPSARSTASSVASAAAGGTNTPASVTGAVVATPVNRGHLPSPSSRASQSSTSSSVKGGVKGASGVASGGGDGDANPGPPPRAGSRPRGATTAAPPAKDGSAGKPGKAVAPVMPKPIKPTQPQKPRPGRRISGGGDGAVVAAADSGS